MQSLEKAKAWMKLNPPRERIVDHKIMQSYCHEYPIIRDLVAEVEQLMDHIDLMADEFKRIRSVHPEFSQTMHNKEVRQLCDRAISNTKQRVPVIEQRDKAEMKAERIEHALSPLIDLTENYNGQSGCDCLKIIRAVLAEAVRG